MKNCFGSSTARTCDFHTTNLWDLICNDTSNSARLIHIFDMKSKSIAGTKKHQDILLISNIAKDRRSLKDIFLLKKEL